MASDNDPAAPPAEPRWALSFRATHPSADLAPLAARVGAAFGAAPKVLWRAGDTDARATPPRLHARSYCSVRWPGRGETIEQALGDAIDALTPLQAELAAIGDSGGAFNFFAGLFFARTMGVVLPPALLARLGVAGIELQLDLYGGAQRA